MNNNQHESNKDKEKRATRNRDTVEFVEGITKQSIDSTGRMDEKDTEIRTIPTTTTTTKATIDSSASQSYNNDKCLSRSTDVKKENVHDESTMDDGAEGEQVAFDDEDEDDDDDETRPGAFRIGGMRNDDYTSDENVAFESVNDDEGHHPNNAVFQAEQVDEEALEQQYKEIARQEILQRIQDETTAHAVQINPTDADTKERPKANVNRLLLVFVLLVAILCGIVIPIALRSSKNKQQGQSHSPTGIPNDNESTDFDFVEEQILLQLAKNSTKVDYRNLFRDPSTAQYKALDWLINDDPALLNVRETVFSVLLDRYVLAVLYFATNGPNWLSTNSGNTGDDHFLSKSPVCEWGGVTCDVTDSVVSIQIESNNLQGTMPMELSLLTSFEEIVLGFNKLSGTIPSEIARLSRLEWLQLSKNSLTGSIPDDFQYLTNLETLFLAFNQLTGTIPAGLIQLPLLEIFHVGFNLLSGTIPEMNLQRQQDSLERLALGSNMLSGSIPDSVFMLKNLEELWLDKNQLIGTIPSEIGLLTQLVHVWLDGNLLSGTIPTEIGSLEYMHTLSLSKSNQLNGTIPTEFGKLTSLRLAFLNDNQFSGTLPSELGQATNLKGIFVDGNPITGTVPSTFSQLTLLEFANLSKTNLTGDLDSSICNQTNRIKLLVADCQSPSPEVNCSCCTACCKEGDVFCPRDTKQACNNYAKDLEYNILQNQAACSCPDDNVNISCDLMECPTCKDDLSVCGVTTEFQLTLSPFSLAPTRWISTMKYETGQHANRTLSWQYDTISGACEVYVNGVQCNSCRFGNCEDGFRARQIDCSNILNVDGPLSYKSCSKSREEGSILDIIQWVDTNSWTGCPFVPDEYIL